MHGMSGVATSIDGCANPLSERNQALTMSGTPHTTPPVNPYESPASSGQRRSIPLDVQILCALSAVVSVLGCVYIFRYWWLADSLTVGLIRCAVFAAVMTAVHLVGYRLWKRQQAVSATNTGGSHKSTSIWWRILPGGLFWVFAIIFVVSVMYSLIL